MCRKVQFPKSSHKVHFPQERAKKMFQNYENPSKPLQNSIKRDTAPTSAEHNIHYKDGSKEANEEALAWKTIETDSNSKRATGICCTKWDSRAVCAAANETGCLS